MFYALRAGKSTAADALVQKGANVDAAIDAAAKAGILDDPSAGGVTMLMRAAARGDVPTLTTLLRHRAAPDATDDKGRRLELLLDHGARPAARDAQGDTALHGAVRAADAVATRRLLAVAPPPRGGTLLTAAAADGGASPALQAAALPSAAVLEAMVQSVQSVWQSEEQLPFLQTLLGAAMEAPSEPCVALLMSSCPPLQRRLLPLMRVCMTKGTQQPAPHPVCAF